MKTSKTKRPSPLQSGDQRNVRRQNGRVNFWETIVDYVPIGILHVSTDGHILEANSTVCKMLEYDRSELCGMNIAQIGSSFPPDGLARTVALETGGTTFAVTFKTKRGQPLATEVNAQIISLRGDRHVLLFVTDISTRQRLEQDQQLLSAAIASTKDCISITDLDNRFLFVNKAFQDAYGYAPEELVGKHVSILRGDTLPEDIATIILPSTLSGGWYGELMNRRKDGSEFPVELWTSVVKDPHGTPVALVGIARDITARREAERKLKQTEQHYRDIFTRAPLGIYQSTEDGRFINANYRLAQILGYDSPEELLALDLDRDVYWNKGERQTLIARHKAAGPTPNLELLWKKKDGTPIWVELSAYMERDAAGGLTYYAGFVQDITKRKQTGEALQLNEERLRLAMLASRQGWFDLDLRTGNITVSPEYARMLGYSPQEFSTNLDTWKESLHPDDKAQVLKRFGKCLQTDQPYSAEYRRKTKQGDWKWLLSTGKVVERDEQGRPLRMIGAHIDISDRKSSEAALLESQHQLLESQRVARLGHYVFDVASGLWEGSKVLHDIFGIKREFKKDVAGWMKIVHPDHRQEMLDHLMNHVLKERHPFDHEYQIVRMNDGQVRWVHGQGELELNEDGTPLRMIGTIQDITERRKSEDEIKHNLSLLQATLESTADGILVVNNEGNIIGFNSRFKDMWHIPEHMTSPMDDAILLQFVLDQVVEPETFLAKVQDIYSRPLAESFDVIQFKDGRTFERYSLPQRIGTTPVGRVWSFRDVTERRRSDELLRHSEEQNRAILNAVPDLLFRINREGVILDYRAPDLSNLYVPPESFLGRPVHEVLPPVVAEPAMKAIADALTTGRVSSFEYALDMRGEKRFYENRTVAFSGDEVLSVIRDLTDRKRAEEAVRESEERFRTTLYSIGDGVITTDTAGSIVQMNRVAESLTGWTESEAQGKNIAEVFRIVDEDSQLPAPNPVERVLKEGIVVGLSSKTMLLSRDGKLRPISDSGAPIRNLNGTTTGVVLVFNDQTERRELYSQLIQAQKMEAVGRLAGGVAHDFNNMVGVILGYAKLMEHELNEMDPLYRYVQSVIGAAERSANLTRQLLAFARKQVVSPVPLNLNDALTGLQRMLMRLIGEDITLELTLARDLWNIKMDPSQVDQIFTNLATNSRDAIKDVGKISIETSNIVVDETLAKERLDAVPGEYVHVSFQDNGGGMNKATLARIFEPFFTTKPQGRGTGLGLATVFGIIKQNYGFITVESKVGKGTTFNIYIPRSIEQVSAPVQKHEEQRLRGNETILLVEDEEQLLALAQTALELQGYTVLAAKSPGDAIVIYERSKRKVDLLVTDVVMPDMNGKELKERLDSIRPGMKTIYMSGYTADAVSMRGIMETGSSFLQKPFTPVQLARKVRETLDA